MGIIKQAVIVCICLLVVTRISRVLRGRLPSVVGGKCRKDFQRVADVFRANVESGKEPGGALAVYYKGELVVDLWGGYADVESERPWSNDTVSLVFSCTKGVAAVVVAKLVQNGYLDYTKPVKDYWPEFGQNDKDNITVEMLLSHQAGLVLLDEPVSVYDLKTNPQLVSDRLAKQTTAWPAGSRFGYHAITYGLYVDQLVRRVDPEGRDTATVFREDIAEPFDIDFGMNLPLKDNHRAARLYARSKLQMLIDSFTYTRYLRPLAQIIFSPDSLMAKCMTPVNEYNGTANILNNPSIRDVTVSSISGTGTARGLAKLFGTLAVGGTLQNKELLSSDLIRRLSTSVMTGQDAVMETGETSQIGPGTLFHKTPQGEFAVGHTGYGGQVAVADLRNGLGIAYITNHLTINGVADDPRYRDLEDTLYQILPQITNTES